MSKPGSLWCSASVRGYNSDGETGDAPAILPSVTGLRHTWLRACSGGEEEMLNELDMDRLALTAERPSDMLSDITPARCVVANSLSTHLGICEQKRTVVRRLRE
jgi:hypothetical protein